jgi:hypothetical protein
VSILKSLNEQLSERKVYSKNFDKLAEYTDENVLNNYQQVSSTKHQQKKAVKFIEVSPPADKNSTRKPYLSSEEDASDHSCLST